MSNKDKLIYEWINKADADLKNAEILLKEGGTIDAVCFHSQQAVEKYLKAFLVYKNLPVQKIHSLVALAKQGAKKEPSLLDYLKEYKLLEAYYIESRYPPDIRAYSQNEGKQAYQVALEISEFIKNLIKK